MPIKRGQAYGFENEARVEENKRTKKTGYTGKKPGGIATGNLNLILTSLDTRGMNVTLHFVGPVKVTFSRQDSQRKEPRQ
jgi:hypothetical protein